MFSAISVIATLTRSGNAVAPTGWIWLLFFTAVPLLSEFFAGTPTPTTRQVSSGGPPPQVLRDPGQPLPQPLMDIARGRLGGAIATNCYPRRLHWIATKRESLVSPTSEALIRDARFNRRGRAAWSVVSDAGDLP
jgi:hypothetical protein